MNILYFFPELFTPMYRWQRIHFIEELSHHNCNIEVFNPLIYNSPEEANIRLLEFISTGKYDLFFTNVCYEDMLFVDTLLSIKRRGIPSLCLRCDNLVIPYQDKKLAPLFDLVWLTSIETKHIYDKWGANSMFAPYAANPYTFTAEFSNLEKKVVFIGTPYGSRSHMINTLTSNELPVDVYTGNMKKSSSFFNENNLQLKFKEPMPSKWSVLLNRFRFNEGRILLKGTLANKFFHNEQVLDQNDFFQSFPGVMPEKMYLYYSKYILCLASTSTGHTDILKHPLKIVNLRNFEIPMCGGIEFCKFNPELASYFEADKEIIFYDTDEEMLDKARFYLLKASQEEILKIKSAAHLRAVNEHTWWNRFSKAFAILGIK